MKNVNHEKLSVKIIVKIVVGFLSLFAMFISFQTDSGENIPFIFAMCLLGNVDWESIFLIQLGDKNEKPCFGAYYMIVIIIIIMSFSFSTLFKWNPEKANHLPEQKYSEDVTEEGEVIYHNISISIKDIFSNNANEKNCDCLPERCFIIPHNALYFPNYYITAYDLGKCVWGFGALLVLIDTALCWYRSRCEDSKNMSDKSINEQVKSG